MAITTIAVENDVKDKIRDFGTKGETYSQILNRLVESAQKRQLHDLLMNEEGTIPIEKAIENARKRWSK